MHDFVPFQGLLYVFDYQNDVDTESYAGFLHIDYKFTDQFGITVGGRYTKEDKKFIGGQADLNGFAYKISGCIAPDAIRRTRISIRRIPPGVTCQQALGFPDAEPTRSATSRRTSRSRTSRSSRRRSGSSATSPTT